ncbi:hypothetical protein HK100_009758 [Physocladia obscura]|uniref:TIR domain-containing protein n=1 Tax=Physocladia obscura TaxID=109957 RepID=A0AAD5T5R9_9FUNG|nr:hypothetical protein HK100_009758 [Physocladia obscura]
MDVDEILPLLQRGAPSSTSNIAIRKALEEFHNKFPSRDADLIKTIVVDQLIPILKQDDPEQTLDWFSDALVQPISDLLIVENVWNTHEDTAVLIQVLDLLFDRILIRNLGREFDWYKLGLISHLISLTLRRNVFKLEKSVDVTWIEKWVPLCDFFDIGDNVKTLYEKAEVDISNLKFPIYNREEKEKESNLNVIPLTSCLDDSVYPQMKRKALYHVISVSRIGNNSSSTRKEKEASALIQKKFASIAVDLMKNKNFFMLADLFGSIFLTADKSLLGEAIPNCLIQLALNVKAGDISLLEYSQSVLIVCLQEVGKSHKDRIFEVLDSLSRVLDLIDSQSADFIVVQFHAMGTEGDRAALKNLGILISLAQKGNQIVVGDISASLLGSFWQQTELFVDHFDELLLLLPTLSGGVSGMVIANIVQSNPSKYATKEALAPIITALKSPESKAMSVGGVSSVVMTIYAAIATYSLDGCKLCTPLIMSEIEGILKTDVNRRDPYISSAVTTLLLPLSTIAKDYPEILSEHEKTLDALSSDPVAKDGSVGEMLDSVLNSLHGVSLKALAGKLSASMKSLGINPDDPFFEAVEESLKKEGKVPEYDCMLSYNWSQKSVVLRIRDSLVARGLSVWLDLEQMSGNVYGKMADAVLGSKVIIPCLSITYESSGNCKRELGFAADQTRTGKKIVPVRLDDGPFTWTALITSGLLYTYIGENEINVSEVWERVMDSLAREVFTVVGLRNPVTHIDEIFDAAVKESLNKDNLTEYDCMLSYNWTQQSIVVKIHDALVDRGLSVWIDMEQMSGNVYGKMADAVLGSKVVVSCLSATYEVSENCKRELDFAFEQVKTGKQIVVLELDNAVRTWSNACTEGFPRLEIKRDLGDSDVAWNAIMDTLANQIQAALERGQVLKRKAAKAKNAITEHSTPTPTKFVSQTELEARIVALESLVQSHDELKVKVQALENTVKKQSAIIFGLSNFVGINFGFDCGSVSRLAAVLAFKLSQQSNSEFPDTGSPKQNIIFDQIHHADRAFESLCFSPSQTPQTLAAMFTSLAAHFKPAPTRHSFENNSVDSSTVVNTKHKILETFFLAKANLCSFYSVFLQTNLTVQCFNRLLRAEASLINLNVDNTLEFFFVRHLTYHITVIKQAVLAEIYVDEFNIKEASLCLHSAKRSLKDWISQLNLVQQKLNLPLTSISNLPTRESIEASKKGSSQPLSNSLAILIFNLLTTSSQLSKTQPPNSSNSQQNNFHATTWLDAFIESVSAKFGIVFQKILCRNSVGIESGVNLIKEWNLSRISESSLFESMANKFLSKHPKVANLSLIYRVHDDESIPFYADGFHCRVPASATIYAKPTGIALYPAVFSFPEDPPIADHWPNIVSLFHSYKIFTGQSISKLYPISKIIETESKRRQKLLNSKNTNYDNLGALANRREHVVGSSGSNGGSRMSWPDVGGMFTATFKGFAKASVPSEPIETDYFGSPEHIRGKNYTKNVMFVETRTTDNILTFWDRKVGVTYVLCQIDSMYELVLIVKGAVKSEDGEPVVKEKEILTFAMEFANSFQHLDLKFLCRANFET